MALKGFRRAGTAIGVDNRTGIYDMDMKRGVTSR